MLTGLRQLRATMCRVGAVGAYDSTRSSASPVDAVRSIDEDTRRRTTIQAARQRTSR